MGSDDGISFRTLGIAIHSSSRPCHHSANQVIPVNRRANLMKRTRNDRQCEVTKTWLESRNGHFSSQRPQGPSQSPPWCQRSSSRRTVVGQRPSCARSKRRPWPFFAPPICDTSQYRFPCTRNSQSPNVPSNNVLVLPADLVAETANGAVLATGLESEDSESLGNDHLLLLVVGRGNTIEDLKALQSGGTTGGLVGDHATDGLVEDSGGGTEVEGTYIVVNGHALRASWDGIGTHLRGWGCIGSSFGGRRGT